MEITHFVVYLGVDLVNTMWLSQQRRIINVHIRRRVSVRFGSQHDT
jgi:hypothetical protein